MKGLQAAFALVFSFMVISPRVNAQTPDTNVKPQNEKLQVESTPNQNLTPNRKALSYLKQGHTFLKNRNYPEAIKAFDQVIKIQPNNQYAYQGKGATYLRTGQFKQAKTDLDKSIQLDNSLSYAHYYRGLVNIALANKDNANTDFETAANLFEKEGKPKLANLSREFKKHYSEYLRRQSLI